MKICVVVDNLDTKAGWGRLAVQVIEGLRARGHVVNAIVQHGISGPGTLVTSFGVASFLDFCSLPLRLFRARKFACAHDVVLCYDVNPYGIFIGVALIGSRTRLVLDCLGTYSLLSGGVLKKALARWTYRIADKVLVVSAFTKRQIERSGVRLGQTHLVPVGVDADFFRGEHTAPPIASPYILSVGGIKPRKGYDLSLRAFAVLAGRFPNLHYVIIGDQGLSRYVEKLNNLISALGIRERVLFIQKVSDETLRSYYHAAKAFVLTSVTDPTMIEGFGMVYLEAGACGVPVVGPKGTGAESAIVDGVTGFLTTHEPTDIAFALEKILSDDALAAELGRRGEEHARQFDWRHIVTLYEEHLFV